MPHRLKPEVVLIDARPERAAGHLCPQGYGVPAFWKAYATIYWPDMGDANQMKQIKGFARQVVKALPPASESEPLRVLALGFGIGALELPLLSALRNTTRRSLDVVGVDFAPMPLGYIAGVIESSWPRLPRTGAGLGCPFREPDPGRWVKLSSARLDLGRRPAEDRFLLVCDDLDFEPANPDGTDAGPRPSNWDRRVRHLVGDVAGFDLVFASFCLFHLQWWRSTLMRSLLLLRPGGVFLHSKASGDENLFEGRAGGAGYETRAPNAKSVFLDGIFADPRVRRFLERPRPASAARPSEIEQFLERLVEFGLEVVRPSEPDYVLSARVSRETYLEMLRTRGFSTFRLIEEAIGGPEAYNQLFESLSRHTGAGATSIDQLAIEIDWQVFRLAQPRALRRFPLAARFSGVRSNRGATGLSSAYRREFELLGAMTLHAGANREAPDFTERLAREVGVRGLLHESCQVVEFGFQDPRTNTTRWEYFVNPYLAAEATRRGLLRDLHTYLTTLAVRTREFGGFSNTRFLLERVLPILGRAVCFVYYWPTQDDQRNPSVRFASHRDFVEVQFHLPGRAADRRYQYERLRALAWQESRPARGMTADGPCARSLLWTAAGWVEAENSDTAREAGHLYPVADGVEKLRCSLVRSLEEPTVGDASFDARKLLEEALSDPRSGRAIAQGLMALADWPDTKLLAIFPAADTSGDRLIAKDLLLQAYSEVLQPLELESEFEKVRAVFEQTLFRQAREQSVAATLADFGHETKKLANAIRSWPVPLDALFAFDAAGAQPRPDKLGAIQWFSSSGLGPAEFSVVPMPQVLRAAAALLETWTFTADPASLPFGDEDLPERMKDLVARCWRSTILGLLVHRVREKDLRNLSTLKGESALSDTLLAALVAPECTVNACPNLVWRYSRGAGEESEADQRKIAASVWLARLFLQLSREQLQHRADAVVHTEISKSDRSCLELQWVAKWRPEVSPSSCAELMERLAGSDAARIEERRLGVAREAAASGGRGRQVRRHIVGRYLGGEVMEDDSPCDGQYKFHAAFKWPAGWKE